MPSHVSLDSDSGTTDSSSMVSVTPEACEDGDAPRRRDTRRQARRYISTTFSEASESEISDMPASHLGRRVWDG
jgi:hypothetical protein